MPDDIRVEFDVPAPMRDGAVLRANVFHPAEAGTYPVILARTPYAKDFGSVSPFIDSVRMARAGYIVVLQDTRGRFRSDGEWAPMRHEGPDGYDSVEWAARLPGSNGKVGMIGPSYVGFTQWAAALQRPPSLKAIVPSVTWADPRDGVFWRGGAFEGLGPSATSYVRGVRTKNWANTQLYCEQLEKGRRAIESSEELSPLARAGETAAFGLRMNTGWEFDEFRAVTDHDLREEWAADMDSLVQRGWAERSDSRFRLNERGLRFADAAAELMLRTQPAVVT